MTVEPNSLGRPTAAQIRDEWESTLTPGHRTVWRRLADRGFQTSPSSIARVVKSGFAPCPWETDIRKLCIPKTMPMTAKEHLAKRMASPEAEARLLAAAVAEEVKIIGATSEAAKTRFDELILMTPEQIAERTRKVDLVLGLVLKEEMAQSPKMMMLIPEKCAKLFEALGATMVATFVPDTGPAPARDGSDARVVNGHDKTMSPSAIAIAEFRRKQGQAA